MKDILGAEIYGAYHRYSRRPDIVGMTKNRTAIAHVAAKHRDGGRSSWEGFAAGAVIPALDGLKSVKECDESSFVLPVIGTKHSEQRTRERTALANGPELVSEVVRLIEASLDLQDLILDFPQGGNTPFVVYDEKNGLAYALVHGGDAIGVVSVVSRKKESYYYLWDERSLRPELGYYIGVDRKINVEKGGKFFRQGDGRKTEY